MAQPSFWTTSKKVAFTIALAVIAWALLGCAFHPFDKTFEHPFPASANGETDAAYLQHLYASYNEQYFGNHLTPTPKISVDGSFPEMAHSLCNNDNGTDCSIVFNLHYTAAPRVAESVLLHEMCHIKLWSKHLVTDNFPPAPGAEFYHDKSWRGCMLSLDAAGAFRVINIDFYEEDVH